MGLGGLRRLLGDQQPYLTSGPSWGSGRHGWRRKWHGFLTRGSWRCPWSADESSALKGALNGDESSPLHAHSVSDVFITPDGVTPLRSTAQQSLSHCSTTANPSSNPFFCHPFSCQSFPVSDPDSDTPISTLLRPAQARKPMLLFALRSTAPFDKPSSKLATRASTTANNRKLPLPHAIRP